MKNWDRCVSFNRQMLKTTNPLKNDHVFFAVERINTAASAGRDSYCMYSHTSAFNQLSSPLWLTYLFSLLSNKTKSGLEMQTGGEVSGVGSHTFSYLRYQNDARHMVLFILYYVLGWNGYCSHNTSLLLIPFSLSHSVLTYISLRLNYSLKYAFMLLMYSRVFM